MGLDIQASSAALGIAHDSAAPCTCSVLSATEAGNRCRQAAPAAATGTSATNPAGHPPMAAGSGWCGRGTRGTTAAEMTSSSGFAGTDATGSLQGGQASNSSERTGLKKARRGLALTARHLTWLGPMRMRRRGG